MCLLAPYQPNARKEDLFGRPSQGLSSSSSSSYMASKGLAEASMDRNCLEVNMGSSLPSSQVLPPPLCTGQHPPLWLYWLCSNIHTRPPPPHLGAQGGLNGRAQV